MKDLGAAESRARCCRKSRLIREARTRYVDTIAEENRTVEDAITGKSLSVDEQTILIGVDSSGAKGQRYQTL